MLLTAFAAAWLTGAKAEEQASTEAGGAYIILAPSIAGRMCPGLRANVSRVRKLTLAFEDLFPKDDASAALVLVADTIRKAVEKIGRDATCALLERQFGAAGTVAPGLIESK
jgi:hypothetical protein